MKKLIIIIGFICAIIAVILAVTPLFQIALIPLIAAILALTFIYVIIKKTGIQTKSIQYISVLVIMALTIVIYKFMFSTSTVGDTQELELKEQESVEDSKNLLEDIEIID
ncbi:MAG: FUSC family protein [Bacteroidia bacterium]|nr:FUSC family protein [Bacteroidia bacterium]